MAAHNGHKESFISIVRGCTSASVQIDHPFVTNTWYSHPQKENHRGSKHKRIRFDLGWKVYIAIDFLFLFLFNYIRVLCAQRASLR